MTVRRQPQQRRSRQTVQAVLDAVARVLKREGVEAVTTNRIAEAAGVSIGSVYQYFPDKRAIFLALHDRHVGQIAGLIESTLAEHRGSPVEVFLGALVESLVDAHTLDPQLHELLLLEVPHRADGAHDLVARLRGALQRAIAAAPGPAPPDLDRILFVLGPMVDALCHAAALRRPPRLSLAAAREEVVRAVLACWSSASRGIDSRRLHQRHPHRQ